MPVTLITEEEEESLPDDDEALAFVRKERICREEMNRLLKNYGRDDDDSEVWMEYIIQVRSAAEAADLEVGLLTPVSDKQLDHEYFWKFYESSVKLSEAMKRVSKRARAEAHVTLTGGDKERLRKHLADLRAALDVSKLSSKLKGNLGKRLDRFENELEEERSDLGTIVTSAALVWSAIMGAAGATGGAAIPVEKAIQQLPATVEAINRITGNAKADEIERTPEPKALPAPRKRIEHQPEIVEATGYGRGVGRGRASAPKEAFPADLDDEIPF